MKKFPSPKLKKEFDKAKFLKKLQLNFLVKEIYLENNWRCVGLQMNISNKIRACLTKLTWNRGYSRKKAV